MVETIVTIPRGAELPAAVLGTLCGVVIGRLGLPGLVFTFPMLMLVGVTTAVELPRRQVSSAALAFAAACVAVAALLR